MNLLLDTHLAFWWQTNDARLSNTVRAYIEGNGDQVFVSDISLWELAIKISTGKLIVNLTQFVSNVVESGFLWLPIKNAHILHLPNLPMFPDHKDPFDRLLVAQSASEPLVLLTRDSKLGRYGDLVRVV